MLRQRTLFTSLALIVSSTTLVVAPASAVDLGTCQGKPVTILATETVTTGTEGDDVVATSPEANGWRTIYTLGGNDTICMSVVGVTVGRDPLAVGFVDAGSGDDVVVNVKQPGVYPNITQVQLGEGSDTFTGADDREIVYADDFTSTHSDGPPAYFSGSQLSGAQRDIVTGATVVYSFAPSDGPNEDQISFGSTGATAVLDGPMGANGSLRFPVDPLGVPNTLMMGRPHGVAAAGSDDVVVDNVKRQMTVAGAQVLAWSGRIEDFYLGSYHYDDEVEERPISFMGSDKTEHLSLTWLPVGDVSLGGDRDTVTIDPARASLPRSMDGGSGRDHLVLETRCLVTTIRMGKDARCDGTSPPLDGFEGMTVESRSRGKEIHRITLIGSDAAEVLIAEADRVVMRGGGGDDSLKGFGEKTRLFGDSGRDRIVSGGGDVIASGGPGADHIWLSSASGLSNWQPIRKFTQHVALGGPGADMLFGTRRSRDDDEDFKYPDRLMGGSGYDRANGRGGTRDYCIAEVTKNCERP